MTDNNSEKVHLDETEPAGKVNVLAAEDRQSFRSLYLRLFGSGVFDRFEIEDDGEKALKRFQTDGPYNVLITDNSMPGMDGVTLARKIKEQDPEVFTVLLTSNDLESLNPGDTKHIDMYINKMSLASDIGGKIKEIKKRVRELQQNGR